MSTDNRPPFQYYGGKAMIADQIAALLPAHEHYVEPFAGSLAVLLAKPPSKLETVNDLNNELMTFWRVLRDRPADLERACALTPHSRAEFMAAREQSADDLERARRTWTLLAQGRSAALTPTGWRYHQRGDSTSVPEAMAAFVSRLPAIAQRLVSVSLECRPAVELISAYGRHPDVLIYADPPYIGSTRNGNRSYRLEMADEPAHIELAEVLHAAHAAVVLSGYDCPLYDKLYGEWHRAEISTWTGNGTGNKRRTEVLWSNRPYAIQTLF